MYAPVAGSVSQMHVDGHGPPVPLPSPITPELRECDVHQARGWKE